MVVDLIAVGTYIFVVVATLTLWGGLPVALVSLLIEHRRTHRNAHPVFITVLIAISYLAGGWLGWAARPSAWRMPFWRW